MGKKWTYCTFWTSEQVKLVFQFPCAFTRGSPYTNERKLRIWALYEINRNFFLRIEIINQKLPKPKPKISLKEYSKPLFWKKIGFCCESHCNFLHYFLNLFMPLSKYRAVPLCETTSASNWKVVRVSEAAWREGACWQNAKWANALRKCNSS